MIASPSRSIRPPQGLWAMKAGALILILRKPVRKVVIYG